MARRFIYINDPQSDPNSTNLTDVSYNDYDAYNVPTFSKKGTITDVTVTHAVDPGTPVTYKVYLIYDIGDYFGGIGPRGPMTSPVVSNSGPPIMSAGPPIGYPKVTTLATLTLSGVGSTSAQPNVEYLRYDTSYPYAGVVVVEQVNDLPVDDTSVPIDVLIGVTLQPS